MSNPYREGTFPKYRIINQSYVSSKGWISVLEDKVNNSSREGYRYLNHTDTAGAVTVIMVKE